MKISDLLRMAVQNLLRRKARTALTVLGVVIGTVSIVVMISIGIGMNTQYEQQVMQLGSLTQITMSKVDYGNSSDGYSETKQRLDDKLVKKIQQIDHVDAVIPFYAIFCQYYAKNYQFYSRLYGTDLSNLELLGLDNYSYMRKSNEISDDMIIIGKNTTSYINDKYGNMVDSSEINWDSITLIVQPQGDFTPTSDVKISFPKYAFLSGGADDDQSYGAFVSLAQYRKIKDQYLKKLSAVDQKKASKELDKYTMLTILVDNIDNVSEVQSQIENYGFKTQSLASQLEPMKNTSEMLQMVLGGVGAVAMLVSAISIANTMIMSIYERTREIGIMKVLGCTISDIKKMFLIEAGVIGLFGGIVGDLIGYLGSYLINHFGGSMFSALMNAGTGELEMMGVGMDEAAQVSQFSMIPIWLPLMAAGFAMLVGIISGYYPAKRATKISAIEAMKTDG